MNESKPLPTHQTNNATAEASVQELEELKRDMRTAKLIDWAQAHKQQIIAAAVGVVLAIVGAGLWWEHVKSTREAAAMLYHRALGVQGDERRTLLEKVVHDYKNTSYAAFALMLLAATDEEKAGDYLKALLNHPRLTDELAWQARLDLAAWHLRHGRKDEALSLLSEPVGKHYEQLRHYLMAKAAPSKEKAAEHLRQALAAISHDERLKHEIEQRLAETTAAGG